METKPKQQDATNYMEKFLSWCRMEKLNHSLDVGTDRNDKVVYFCHLRPWKQERTNGEMWVGWGATVLIAISNAMASSRVPGEAMALDFGWRPWKQGENGKPARSATPPPF